MSQALGAPRPAGGGATAAGDPTTHHSRPSRGAHLTVAGGEAAGARRPGASSVPLGRYQGLPGFRSVVED
jgi:hypothetical protein